MVKKVLTKEDFTSNSQQRSYPKHIHTLWTFIIEKNLMETFVLHNYFRLKNNEMYCPSGFVDAKMSDGNTAPGDRTGDGNRTIPPGQLPSGIVLGAVVRGAVVRGELSRGELS